MPRATSCCWRPPRASGLAAFLSRQTGLQLVFLNGCSTQPQVQGLLDAGVSAIIATAQAIDDAVATYFAVRFYKGLAGGASIQTAFHEAEAACKTARGGQLRSVYLKQVISSSATRAVADRWPWALTPRPGAELILQWNLPDAVNDPLFGLPPLPPRDLPANPFRNILWFRREDAPIFFGRGYDIRELHQRITAPDAAPIVLYYGQSGVGKSSLLAAGLLPRLEQVHTVVYARRDQALGLAGTLAANLPGSTDASGAGQGDGLLARWRTVEAETGQPLTVILDQAEEVYTRPNAALRDEMRVFLNALVALFGDPATRPQGRLILSFRKEWLPEIEKLLAERQLPRTKVFLQRLEKRGIVEAVTGPARNERLQSHFGLTVEPELAGEIADDLLSDPSSAVAPTLQILLSKMWRQAKARDYDRPIFSGALYQELRRQGLLLSDFLDQQLATLRGAQSAAVDSGLALDLLAFHTTPLGTAEQRTLAELRAAYAHQAMTLPDLLAACRDLYLLVDPTENRLDAEPASRLAHDTLAPLVRQRFEESDAPGQRARRILENRAVDWGHSKQGAPLDDADLAVVEAGKPGMRAWQPDEVRLFDASCTIQTQRNEERKRIHQAQIEAERREQAERVARAAADARADQEQKNARKLRRRAFGSAIAAITALVLAIVAGILFNEARMARDAAQSNEQAAVDAKTAAEFNEQQAKVAVATAIAAQAAAEVAKAEVERQTRRIRTNELTAVAANIYEQKPQLASLLIAEGIRVQNVRNEALGTDTLASVHSTLSNVGGQPVLNLSSALQSLSISVNGRWTVASAQDGSVYLLDNHDFDAPAKLLALLAGNHTHVAFSPDGRWLMGAGGDELVRLWHSQELDSDPQILRAGDSNIVLGAFSPTGVWLAVHGLDSVIYVWNMESLKEPPRILQSGVRTYAVIRFSPDERWLAAGSWDGKVAIWDLADRDAPPRVLSANVLNNPEDRIADLSFSPDSELIAASSPNKAVHVWGDWDSDAPTVTILHHPDAVYAVSFSPDSRWIATGSDDDNARLWNVDVLAAPPVLLSGRDGNVRHLAFSPGGELLITNNDKNANIWTMDFRYRVGTAMTLAPSAVLRGHEQTISELTFSPDGFVVVTASIGGELRLWNLDNLSAEPQLLRGHDSTKSVRSVVFVEQSARLASAGEDGTVRLWDINQPVEASVLTEVIGSAVYGLSMAPNGEQIAGATGSGEVRVWNISETLATTLILPQTSGTIWSVAFSPDGQWLAAAAEIGVTYLWRYGNLKEGSPERLYGHKRDVYSLSFSADSSMLATGGWDGAVLIYDLKDIHGSPQYLSHPEGGLATVAFSPDGFWLASGGETGIVRLWSVTDISAEPLEFLGHDERIRAVAFSADGEWLASAGQDDVLLLRSMSDLTAIPIVIGQSGSNINSIAFSADGRYIATAHADGGIRLWGLSINEMIDKACTVAGRNMTAEEWAQYFPDEAYRQTCNSLPYNPNIRQMDRSG